MEEEDEEEVIRYRGKNEQETKEGENDSYVFFPPYNALFTVISTLKTIKV